MQGMSRTTALVAAAISLAAVLGALALGALFAPVDESGASRPFAVESGWSAARIAAELDDAGLIRSAFAFRVAVQLAGAHGRLQAGTYILSPAQAPSEIVRAMADGGAESGDTRVTIPEGKNIWEVDDIFAKAGLIRAGEIRSVFPHKEGHLFPETYRIASGSTAEDIVRKMEATYFQRGGTRSDVDVIVASMLEKEAKTAEDMALVAGIIYRRMELGMPLQIDATVGYGWCVRTRGFARDCDVTQAPIALEIKVDGPYNTYARKGLPKGAISNPGTKALHAAANPEKSDYLYYLSTRDGSELIFSRTLQEHLKNRAKYLGF
jgi:UPF0755 protein